MKIWSKLFLVAATGMMMFSSCLENIEPEGIKDLRSSKAELLRAQTALQEAQAAKVNAEAAILQAKAKVEEAIAQQEAAKVAIIEAEALLAQYQAEYQALVNAAYEAEQAVELEKKMAEAAKAKAEAEAAAAKAAAQLELDLLDIQTQVAMAQAAYDHALKDLAAAKVTLSQGQMDYLFGFEMEVMRFEAEVERLIAELEDAAEDLEEAIEVVDENKANKRAIYAAEKAVAEAEAALEGAQEAAELAEAALEIDPFVTDWAEQVEALVNEKEEMRKADYEAALESEAEAQAWRDSVDVLMEAVQKYTDATGYTFNESTGKFSVYATGYPDNVYAPEVYVAAPVDEDGDALFGGDLYINNKYFAYGDTEYIDNLYDERIEDLESLTTELYEKNIESYESQIEAYESDVFFQAELDQYNDAVAAYNDNKIVEYMAEYDEEFDAETPVAEFNAAVKEFEAAHAKYVAEWEKYNPESTYSEDVDKLYAAYQVTADAARKVYVEKRQAELDKRNAAEVEYNKAELAYNRASRSYNAVLNAAWEATGYTTVEELKAAIEKYKTDKKAAADANDATFDADGALAAKNTINETQLANIEAAQAAYDDGKETTTTDACSKWDADKKAWAKAVADYDKNVQDAQNTYAKAIADAVQVRDDAIDDLGVGVTDMDTEYQEYLNDKMTEAGNALQDAIYAVDAIGLIDGDYVEVIYELPYGDYTFWTLDYTTEQTLDGKVFVTVEVADVVDAEYFLEYNVKYLADNLLQFNINAGAYGYDINDEWKSEEDNYSFNIYDYEGYPLVMPEADFINENIQNAENIARGIIERKFYDNHGANSYFSNVYLNGGATIMVPHLETAVEEQKGFIANVDLLPDFIAAIKAAKAEFEAYVAEYEAEIDAIRPYVEANWATYMEQFAEMEAAMEVIEAKYNEIGRTLDFINTMLNDYIGTTDVEAYVEQLEQAYAYALDAVAEAEFDLEDAKADLESVMAGGEDAISEVEMAQKAYDKISEELTEALAELETAAEALQAAMEAIGAVEPEAEETPAE